MENTDIYSNPLVSCSLERKPFTRLSIFLAGPTPRSRDVKSWRPEAVRLILEEYGFRGNVYVPEYRQHIDELKGFEYGEQIEWEHHYLDNCTAILMWVPREMETMPALTTNCEWGLYVKSGRLFYGRPPNAPKCSYLDYGYEKFNIRKPSDTLNELVLKTLNYIDRKAKENYVN